MDIHLLLFHVTFIVKFDIGKFHPIRKQHEIRLATDVVTISLNLVLLFFSYNRILKDSFYFIDMHN